MNGAFFLLDLVFFAANGTKLVEGGFYPLLIGGVLALQMLTWRGGVRLLEAACVDQREDEERFLARLSRAKKRARQGSAPSSAPRREERRCRSLITCETTSRSSAAPLLVSVVPQEVPFVPAEERARVHRLGDGIYRVMLHFGFMEDPDVPAGAQAAPLGYRRRNSKRSATISVGRR